MSTQPDRRQVIARALAVLTAYFDVELTDLRAEAYVRGLRDLTDAEVELATDAAIRTCKFFPRVVELVELARGSPTEAAEEAWTTLLCEMRRVGWAGQPTLPEPIAATVRRLWGSWRHLCETLPGEGPELLGWAKQFKAHHEIHARRQLLGVPTLAELPPHLQAVIRDGMQRTNIGPKVES